MSTRFEFNFIWIPSSLGGHSGAPYEGMRTIIRWQKYINEFIQCARDIQWEIIHFDPATLQGKASCKLSSDAPLPGEWIKDGELIELLGGFNVLAIGRIVK
ncbi:MAG: hypothetical protein ABL933_18370 [Methyloglobulus sp.]|nr:hypothetical protein [Methyloglobulus sp.]